jgi:hypothetical protein
MPGMPQRSPLPLVILFAGFAWYGLLSWIRRRQAARLPAGERPPSPLVLIGLLGLLAAMIVGAVLAFRLWA